VSMRAFDWATRLPTTPFAHSRRGGGASAPWNPGVRPGETSVPEATSRRLFLQEGKFGTRFLCLPSEEKAPQLAGTSLRCRFERFAFTRAPDVIPRAPAGDEMADRRCVTIYYYAIALKTGSFRSNGVAKSP